MEKVFIIMPSLLRNLLIIKDHAPQNLIYSKYQITKYWQIAWNCYELLFLDQTNSSSNQS